jgi:hypothetical protein
MRALVANEPAMYREVISSTLREMRPDVEVFTAEPEDLEGEFLRLVPRLVVFSRATELVEREAPAWVALYPEGASHAIVKSPDGSRRTLPRMDFDALLAVLDAIQEIPPRARGIPTNPSRTPPPIRIRIEENRQL